MELMHGNSQELGLAELFHLSGSSSVCVGVTGKNWWMILVKLARGVTPNLAQKVAEVPGNPGLFQGNPYW